MVLKEIDTIMQVQNVCMKNKFSCKRNGDTLGIIDWGHFVKADPLKCDKTITELNE